MTKLLSHTIVAALLASVITTAIATPSFAGPRSPTSCVSRPC